MEFWRVIDLIMYLVDSVFPAPLSPWISKELYKYYGNYLVVELYKMNDLPLTIIDWLCLDNFMSRYALSAMLGLHGINCFIFDIVYHFTESSGIIIYVLKESNIAIDHL